MTEPYFAIICPPDCCILHHFMFNTTCAYKIRIRSRSSHGAYVSSHKSSWQQCVVTLAAAAEPTKALVPHSTHNIAAIFWPRSRIRKPSIPEDSAIDLYPFPWWTVFSLTKYCLFRETMTTAVSVFSLLISITFSSLRENYGTKYFTKNFPKERYYSHHTQFLHFSIIKKFKLQSFLTPIFMVKKDHQQF